MLETLTIRGYALIDSANLDFSEHLTVLSGETGAGKSILIGALSLLLGGKGDTESIRIGSEEAEITAMVRVDSCDGALGWLADHDISDEDGAVLLRRVLKRNGRGSSFIQSTPATLKDLRDLTGFLFDLHGQHEHQSLFSVDNHRLLLDRFAGLEERAGEVASLFTSLTSLHKELESLRSDERDLLRERDILEYAIHEIDESKLVPGEEEELTRERDLLSQSEKLFSLLEQCHSVLAETKGGALSQLREAMHVVSALAGIDPSLQTQSTRIENAFYEIEDIEQTLRDYLQMVDFSPERLDRCEERLQTIHRLEKKYGEDPAAVLAYREEAGKKLEAFAGRDEEIARLEGEFKEAERRLAERARELSRRRKEAASRLEKAISEALRFLGMPKVRFTVSTGYREGKSGKLSCGPHGYDRIEFLISPNVGEPERPLKDIASGGELSRVMLAIKSVLSETDQVQTLIFDEIDTGIGGEVAVAVARYLAELGKKKQVLCITHLASIAVQADNHVIVEKQERNGRTVTDTHPLSREERVAEVARMLSGTSGGEASLEHARRLLETSGRL
ncbi:DNA repair protein RecN [Sediminispirochaeta smaragdinae]|uniref:DNA repair protein RecN n=1 Tax=Sediminispirochaeta smaragdinae (strain DSM 11293 / JCM 15392 / SEBR 4228) TaxID=573413 RepID=E1R5P7_SEDSS|nr:DNA repair protein RecN [Sediminispirochaeta smaragdinae]ADK80662.1 DNA repair protein RecN [Sediminispirochaeta smaragdinae DSM 11293]